MTETDNAFFEKCDKKMYLANNNIEFQSHPFNSHKNSHNASKGIDNINITPVTSEDVNTYDGITEVSNINSNELEPLEICTILPKKIAELHFNFAKNVSLDINEESYTELKPTNDLELMKSTKPTETPTTELVNFELVSVTELKHEVKVPCVKNKDNISNETTRKPLIRAKTALDDKDFAFQGVSERIKQLSLNCSMDHENDKSNLPSINVEKTQHLIEAKKLSMNPQFQQKMQEIFSPVMSTGVSQGNKCTTYMNNTGKFFPNHTDSNCEIIEENLSPVSETAKHLQNQLSFPSTPMSPDRSPKIPKMTRFARLERSLNQSCELDVQTSTNEAINPN